jgi:hypothetical protein
MNSNVTWITSCNTHLSTTEIYGRCLSTWHLLPGRKIIASEDRFVLPGFDCIDLSGYLDNIAHRPRQWRRFYHKAITIWHTLINCDTEYLIWLDSDVEIIDEISDFTIQQSWATMFHPLWREVPGWDKGVDTGMIIFNKSTLPKDFASAYIAYWHDDKILQLPASKDTWVVCDLEKTYPCENLIVDYKKSAPGTNWFQFSRFANSFIHHIGKANKKINE